MNYPRVNLLKKNERRYQGVVSRRFMLVSIVVTPILMAACLSGIKLVQYSSVQSQLKSSREIWRELEPRLGLFMGEMRGLKANREALELFDAWKKAPASLVGLLEDMQETVPQNIQLRRLSVRSNPQPASFKAQEELALTYQLVVEGVSQGQRAENDVIQLRKELLRHERVASTFESIKLESMRKRQGNDGTNLREFRMVGGMEEGGKQ